MKKSNSSSNARTDKANGLGSPHPPPSQDNCDENYTSVFLKYTSEVMAHCTPDVEFDARVQFRLGALKRVYDADFVAVYAVRRSDGFVDTVFSTEMPDRITLPPRFDLRPILPLEHLSLLKEDELICFARNTHDGQFAPVDRSELPNSPYTLTTMPIIIADRRIWIVVCGNPRRFVEYTLSFSLGAGAIKTELSKRIMLEEIAGGDTPFLQTQLPENSIYVRMLGQFTLRAPGGKLDCYNIGGKQCTVLLAKLLLNPRRLVSASELIDMMSPLSAANNPTNALKSALYRIRRASKPILGSDELIVSHHGSYSLNPDFQFILDTARFELFCNMAKRHGVSDIERMALLEYAIRQYHGGLLPGLETDLSILGQTTYYRLIFESSLEQYLDLLLSTDQYSRIFKTIAHIPEQNYTSPNIYRILIDALMKMGYEGMVQTYFNSMMNMMPRHIFRAVEQEFMAKYGHPILQSPSPTQPFKPAFGKPLRPSMA